MSLSVIGSFQRNYSTLPSKEYPDKHAQQSFNTLKLFYSEIKESDIIVARKAQRQKNYCRGWQGYRSGEILFDGSANDEG